MSYNYTKDEEDSIRQDSFTMWLWVFDVVLIVTLVTVAVIAVTGGRV